MPVDRPTFSEAWHRVAKLRPRLRPIVQARRQAYRGRVYHVLRDPINNGFFRCDEAGYHFVALLDGQRTVAEAWEASNSFCGDDAPTQGEAISLLGQLWGQNLVQADLPPDSEGMFDRHRKRKRKEMGGYLMNIMFAKVPIFDPDRLLNYLVVLLGWVFGPIGMLVWVAAIAAGFWAVSDRWGELFDQSQGVLSWENLPLLWLAFIGTKAVHELGHGIACKRFARDEGVSGEVHTVGIMLLVLFPVPYVDASSSWGFRSRLRRAMVGAAGMYVELAVAAIAAIVWSRTAEGTAVHAVAYNTMFIASVSTLLFNANPLIRFDGYYILSDLLETPNLYGRSKEFLYYLVKKYAYGVRNPRSPVSVAAEHFWLPTYGVASAIYRVFLFVSISIFVFDQLPPELFVVPAVLVLAGVSGWLVVPLWKFGQYLATGPELARARGRAVAVTLATLMVLGAGLGVVPLPDWHRAQGLVEPREFERVVMATDGFLDASDLGGSGERGERALTLTSVGPDDASPPLVRASNPELRLELEQLRAERARLAAQQGKAAADGERHLVEGLTRAIEAKDEAIVRFERDLSRLTLRPTMTGTWVAPDLDRAAGVYLPAGKPVGTVASLDRLVVRVTADQYLGPRLDPEAWVGRRVELRAAGRPEPTYRGRVERVLPAGQRRLPSSALGFMGGGTLATAPDAENGDEAAEPYFELQVSPLTATGSPAQTWPGLRPGQRVVVRFELGAKPIAQQAWLALRQLVQRRLQL